MAIRTQPIEGIARKASRDSGAYLAALPAGSVVGVYANRVDAVGAAVQLSVDNPERKVWLASGEEASYSIGAARGARPLLTRLAGALSDDDQFVQDIVAKTRSGHAVLVVGGDCMSCLPRLAGASQIVEFGRWTTREVRRR